MQEWKESEQRRKNLVREMKAQCRYSPGYPEHLHREETDVPKVKSSFGFRLLLSMMAFLCYLIMNSGSLPVGKNETEFIRQEISRQADLKSVTGFAKELQSVLYFSGE